MKPINKFYVGEWTIFEGVDITEWYTREEALAEVQQIKERSRPGMAGLAFVVWGKDLTGTF